MQGLTSFQNPGYRQQGLQSLVVPPVAEVFATSSSHLIRDSLPRLVGGATS